MTEMSFNCSDPEATTAKEENKLLFLDGKYNFPIESVKGKPVVSFLRKLFLTRRIMKYKAWLEKGGCKIKFN
jgi:hypothetical protein